MAINLNPNQYAAQFSAFVKFAGNNNQGFVARIEKQKPELNLIDPDNPGKLVGPDGQARNIVAKSWDGSGLVLRGKDSRSVNNAVRDLFLETILGVCGAETTENLPQSVRDAMKLEDFDGKGHPLTARRIKAVTKAVQEHLGLTEAAGTFASGSSPAVGKLQHLVMTAPCIPADVTKPIDKMAAFSTTLRENTAKEFATTVPHVIGKDYITDGKIDFNKVHLQFQKDYHRGMQIYVTDDKGRTELERGYEEGRDGLVRFITGGKNDTFDNVSESVKRQTFVLMSILNQFSSTTIMGAFIKTVKSENSAFTFSDDHGAAGTNMDFTLTRKSNGDIQITLNQRNGCAVATVIDEQGSHVIPVDSDTSCCHVVMDFVLTSDKLESVANGDWSKFNYEAFHNQTGDAAEQMEHVPEELRLDIEVTSASAHFDLNAPKVDPYEQQAREALKAFNERNGIKA